MLINNPQEDQVQAFYGVIGIVYIQSLRSHQVRSVDTMELDTV